MNCVITGEPMMSCPHCTDDNYIMVEEAGPDYETLGRAFRTNFRGTCTIDYRHTIKKGDLVAKVRRADNPNILVTGVACKNCTLMLPSSRE